MWKVELILAFRQFTTNFQSPINLTCFWTMGGSRNAWSGHANTTQKGSDLTFAWTGKESLSYFSSIPAESHLAYGFSWNMCQSATTSMRHDSYQAKEAQIWSPPNMPEAVRGFCWTVWEVKEAGCMPVEITAEPWKLVPQFFSCYLGYIVKSLFKWLVEIVFVDGFMLLNLVL